jgi:hypothetical protein
MQAIMTALYEAVVPPVGGGDDYQPADGSNGDNYSSFDLLLEAECWPNLTGNGANWSAR